MGTSNLNWGDINTRVDGIVRTWVGADLSAVVGIPRGGCVPAAMVAERSRLPIVSGVPDGPAAERVLVVDDLVDSGDTWRRVILAPGSMRSTTRAA